MKMNQLKTAIVTAISVFFNWLGVLALPILILLGCNLCDYYTGINAAKYRNPDDKRPIKSYKSIRGISKKVCMYILIIIGWFIDILIEVTLSPIISVALPPVFAITVACWLIFNEIISILENVDDMGVEIPPFLLPILKKMKEQLEDKAESK